MTELNKEFIKETGFDIFSEIEDKYTVYTTEYVEWLEAKINYTRCCETLPNSKEPISLIIKQIEDNANKIIEEVKNVNKFTINKKKLEEIVKLNRRR